jgi:Tol biopolymer transport system component/tRNA A-37 threonylcarbamoyl transferase component Bud32
MPLPAGKRLGSYEILSVIGVGGMGVVYKARDTRLDRIVAIKVLPEEVARDAELRQRFEREARAISSLTHPHICTLHDVGSDDGIEFLVMEHLEGETAAQRLTRGAIPLQQALRAGAEIAEALDRAHRSGLTHRDLKPGNVMLTKAGAKLLDFGLAKLKPSSLERGPGSMATAMPRDLTGGGAIVGTLQYMAPEQLEGGTVDHRADIFAFGATLYEMVTGKKAFEGGSQASLIGSILRDEPAPISALQPLSPAALDALVETCLAKDPDERWQSAADVARQLRLMQGSSAEMLPAAARVSYLSRVLRRERAIWFAALLATGAAAAFAALRLRSAPPAPETHVDVVTPATRDPFSFALSPDGRKLVFAADEKEDTKLWIRSFGGSTAAPLQGSEDATYPFWSPDSESVGFFAQGKLKRLDIAGGPARVLADASEGRGGTWNADNIIVFSPAPGAALQRVSAAGGEAKTLGVSPIGRFPQFLPDGRRFIFLDQGFAGNDPPGIRLGSLDRSESRFLAPSRSSAMFLPPSWLLLVSGTTLVALHFDPGTGAVGDQPTVVADPVGYESNIWDSAVSVSDTGIVAYRANARSLRQLTWFDRAGHALGVVCAPDSNDLTGVELSPNEREVAVTRFIGGARGVWLLDTARGVFTRLVENRGVGDPRWSPDGLRVAYTDSDGIRVRNISDGSEELVVRRSTPRLTASDWSPDGRGLLYTANGDEDAADVWFVALDGDKTPTRVVATRFEEDGAQFAPDGRWVVFRSDESGRSEIYLQEFPGPGRKVQVSTQGGVEPRWSRDGSELYYVSLQADMMAVAVNWGNGSPQIGSASTLFRVHKARGATGNVSQQYSVSSDGRFLINVSTDDGQTSPISLLLNWKAPR